MNDELEPQAEASPKNKLNEEPIISSKMSEEKVEEASIGSDVLSPHRMDPYELEYILEQN